MEGVHAGIDEPLDARSGGIAGDCDIAEAVDRLLNDDVGNGEQRALDSCGESDDDHLQKFILVEFHLLRLEAVRLFDAHHIDNDEHTRERLGNDGCRSNAVNVHLEQKDKHEVEKYVDDTCNDEENERAGSIPYRAQNGGTEVVGNRKRNPYRIDFNVKGRLEEQRFGRIHPTEKCLGTDKTDDAEQDAADCSGRDGGMYEFMERLFVAGAEISGSKHTCTDRESDEKIDDKINERARRTDSGKCRVVRGVAHDDDVRGIKKELQYARQDDGQGIENNTFKERPPSQIDGGCDSSLCAVFGKRSVTSQMVLRQKRRDIKTPLVDLPILPLKMLLVKRISCNFALKMLIFVVKHPALKSARCFNQLTFSA